MGAILAVFGELGDPELSDRLDRMIAVSPYRGTSERVIAPGAAMAIQTLGWDASIVRIGDLVVAIHGYIGNWDELSRAAGLLFGESALDAERFAAGFEALGDSLFVRLRGEFAAVILNRREDVVRAVRSVTGGRPLVLTAGQGRRYIASEVRQVLAGSGALPVLDEEFLVSCLAEEFSDSGATLFAGVRQVAAGCVSTFRLAGHAAEDPAVREFWTPPRPCRERYDFDDLTADLRHRLENAVRRALPARPFGVFLSGGVDSSTVWGLVEAERRRGDGVRLGVPFSAVYPGWDCDESPFIRSTHRATGTEGVLVDATAARSDEYLVRTLPGIDWLEGPQGMAQDLLAARAREDGRQVVFDGYGGDEWLGGNLRYLADMFAAGRIAPWLRDLARLDLPLHLRGRALLASALPFRLRFWRRHGRVRPEWLGRGFRSAHPAATPASFGDLYRERILWALKAVRSGITQCPCEQELARIGVELRSPLMDLDLVEFAFATPGRAFIEGRRFKHLYRAAARDVLSPAVYARIVKTGFNRVLLPGLEESVRDNNVRGWTLVERGVLDVAGMEALVLRIREDPAAGYPASTWWNLLAAELFCRRFA